MTHPLAVLVVEDCEEDVLLLVLELERGGYEVRHECVQTAEKMVEALRRGRFDLVISDCVLPGFSGLEALSVLKASGLDLPFIMMSGALREEDVVGALRAGAHDFVVKGRMARLLPAVARELGEAELRRRYREALARMVRTEKLRALGQLAAGIAHDLRNIFTPILLQVRRLRRQARAHPRHLGGLDTIERQLEVGVEVVGRLDLFGRTENDEPAGPSDLPAAARSAVELCMHRARAASGVRLAVEEVGPTPAVRASAGELVASVVNLVANALDAVGAAGEIHVRTGACDGGAYVEVVDDGPGMPPEVQRRLFEPFFTTKEHGTGLGLSIVRAFVERAGGRLTIDTAPGEGTRVRLWFPELDAAAADPAADPRTSAA